VEGRIGIAKSGEDWREHKEKEKGRNERDVGGSGKIMTKSKKRKRRKLGPFLCIPGVDVTIGREEKATQDKNH